MQPGGCMSSDRIEKKILLRAPLARVWRALSDSTEFGLWFGMRFTAAFTPGALMRGVIVPTVADPEVAKARKQYEGIPFEITIQEMEPERRFSFRWHPGAIDPAVDYSAEPTTLVVFELEQTAEGVLLTLTESGFDQIPLARRAQAFTQNEQGWAMVVKMLGDYVVHAP
uniref:Activator of Hsp90 ATPase 1 family protein n=1 Tax=Solibacter usitatus (strain Ellin6076) TaxID=234267 RepID=Q027C6_SOLUE